MGGYDIATRLRVFVLYCVCVLTPVHLGLYVPGDNRGSVGIVCLSCERTLNCVSACCMKVPVVVAL